MATAKSTPPPHWLLRWTLVAVVVVVMIPVADAAFRYVKSHLPGGASGNGEKMAATELCWQEQGSNKQGTRIDGGACDALDRLFLPKINQDAYGIYNPNAPTRPR